MPMSLFGPNADPSKSCILLFSIAHMRDSEGYTNDWFDADNVTDKYYTYTMTIPANSGSLYFSAESYYYNMIPESCM